MTRFPPMYLNNNENNIVSSIIDEEMSELKDATFSTQSNISMNSPHNTQKYQNLGPKSPQSLISSKEQNQNYSNNFSSNQLFANNYQNEKFQGKYHSKGQIKDFDDVGASSASETSQAEENYKKIDISEIKLEVDSLMSHVRDTTKSRKAYFDNTTANELANKAPSISNYRSPTMINDHEHSFARNNSSTNSPFMFQAASNSQNQKKVSPQRIQNQYENSDLNSSAASYFSNKWKNYDSRNNSMHFSNENSQHSNPHVEFPDFQSKYSQAKSLYSKFSKDYFEDEEDRNDDPFVLPQAQFPDAPKVLQYKYSRRPDSSKKDLAELDGLRKENFKLKAEILKLEKRLQLEEEEHKKLINSLEKSERIRAEYRAKIDNQNH